MWKISEGDTKSHYIIKLMPPKDLEFREPKVSKCQKLSIQAPFGYLVLQDGSRLIGVA